MKIDLTPRQRAFLWKLVDQMARDTVDYHYRVMSKAIRRKLEKK